MDMRRESLETADAKLLRVLQFLDLTTGFQTVNQGGEAAEEAATKLDPADRTSYFVFASMCALHLLAQNHPASMEHCTFVQSTCPLGSNCFACRKRIRGESLVYLLALYRLKDDRIKILRGAAEATCRKTDGAGLHKNTGIHHQLSADQFQANGRTRMFAARAGDWIRTTWKNVIAPNFLLMTVCNRIPDNSKQDEDATSEAPMKKRRRRKVSSESKAKSPTYCPPSPLITAGGCMMSPMYSPTYEPVEEMPGAVYSPDSPSRPSTFTTVAMAPTEWPSAEFASAIRKEMSALRKAVPFRK
jgi:hypothetical protein